MKLSEIAAVLGTKIYSDDVECNGVSIDSRTIKSGELFVAICGPNFDGHNFIKEVARKGASATVVSQEVEADIPIITVSDTHKALINLAIHRRQQFNIPVIAVTGSCGKTTTRALLNSVFSQAGKVLASEKSFNNDFGVPLTLLRLSNDYQYAICELGANHPGEIAKLTHIVKPDVAIITNAAAAHLEGFGDLDGVACAKGEIFQGLNKKGTAIINNDDHYVDFWRKLVGARHIITFGIEQSADVMATQIKFNVEAQPTFRLETPSGSIDVQLQLIGEHNVMNALAAAAAGVAQGLTVEQIKRGLESCVAVNKRLLEKKGYGGARVIDDTYNANPLSVKAAMSVLAKRNGEKVLVLGDMLELGEQADQLHEDIGKEAERCGIDHLFCFGELSRHAVAAFGREAYHFNDRDELIDALKPYLNDNVTVLVKGSSLMRMDLVAAALLDA